jgi:monoterpene epsilon-lactone hydrolase
MSAQDTAAIASFKAQWRLAAANRRGAPLSIDEQRSSFEEYFRAVPVADGCVVQTISAPRIAGETIVPKGATPLHALLYFHGGGFFFGSLQSHRHLVSRLAVAAGITAVSIDYRLAPEHHFPAALGDALAAYRWLLVQGFPPTAIVLAGDSAGGNLAVAAVLKIRDEGLPSPGGLYLISAWLDLTLSGESYGLKASQDPILARESMREVVRLYLGQADGRNPYASPVNGDLSGFPPLMIQVGADEVLLSESLALAQKAALQGVDVRLHVWPEMVHAWPLFHTALPQGTRAIAEAGLWIRETLSLAP